MTDRARIQKRVAPLALGVVLAVALTGCVPGQPDRAKETAEAFIKAYVGITDNDPQDYACPGVPVKKREPQDAQAQITEMTLAQQATSTFIVDATYESAGTANQIAITTRQDGACVLKVEG